MRKIIATFFLTIFLLSNTEAGQLLKTKDFVDHYIEHNKANPSLSVWAFFQLHYSDAPPHDNNDMKLPFKTHHDCCSGSTIVFFHAAPSHQLPATEKTVVANFPLYKNACIPTAASASIFQPPRI